MSLSLAQIQSLLRQVGWPEDQIAKAAAIAIYESGGKPGALNDGSRTGTNEYSVGLFQINTLAHQGYSLSQLQDPATNATIALQLWRARPSYGDWYNSNLKFQRDYQGVASQSNSIYGGGAAGGFIPTADLSSPTTQIWLGLGALALMVLLTD